MPTPIGSDSHDVIIIDCQEAAGATTLTNVGTDTGHTLTLRGGTIAVGVTGLGPGATAARFPPGGSTAMLMGPASDTGPSAMNGTAGWSLSMLYKRTEAPSGHNGPLWCKTSNTSSFGPPYLNGLYELGDASLIASYVDNLGNEVRAASGIVLPVNTWCLISQSVDLAAHTSTLRIHKVDPSTGIISLIDSQTVTIANHGAIGSGPWMSPGFNYFTGADYPTGGDFARLRVRDQPEGAAFWATLLTLYRDGPPAPPVVIGPDRPIPVRQSGALTWGVDISTFPGLDPMLGPLTGPRVVAEAVARRLRTPRGGLSFYPDFGLDLRGYLLAPLSQAGLSGIRAAVEAEAQKDERVLDASATVQFVSEGARLLVSLTLTTASGPFKLTLLVSKLDVSITTLAA